MNSSLVGSAENPNHIEAKNETISFQLYAKPYINFNGGYLPDIYEYKIDSRKGIQQNQYLKQGDKVIIDVLMADTDFDVSRLAYRINGALTWTTILPINIESLDSVNLLYRFTKDITGEFGILQGKNIVEIHGYDQRNHETTSVLVFYYDTTPPQLTINDITNIGIGNTIGAESPVITFTINDGQFGQIQSTGWYVPRLATYFQSGFVSLQNQTTFLFDFDLNLTKITESTFTCTIDKSFLKYGANTIYFFVKDRSNNVNIVPISLYRNGSFTTFEFNDFEWRYVNEPVPLSVTAKQYIAYENNGQTWYNTITASRDKTLRLGISDVLTYEQIEQEFVATSNTLTTVGIRAFTEYKLLRFPILVEVLDTRNNVLSSGYVYPQSSEATSSRSSADIPDIVLTVGEIYKIRITPQEAGYNFYRVSYVPNPIPTENLGGQLYGYIRGIKIPIQGQIWLRLSGGSIEYLGTAGQIQYKVNNGALSPIYYNGVCEAIIESSIQGINVVTVNVALDFGLIYQNNITYFWVTPNTHTTPQITYYSPEINKIYQKELGVHYTYSYPEYNEMYDIQYFLFDEVADQLYWLGNDTVWWEDIDYNENIGYFEFDTNATINGIRWIPDSSQYQLLIYINDTAIVNNRIYEDIQQVYSDRFTINNVGPNINVSRPAQLTLTNDQLDISLDIVIYGAELYNILFYFDINEKAYSTLSQRYYSQFEDPIGTYHYGLTTIIDLPDMTEGLHSITFIVEDVNGIQSRISIDYFYDLQNQAKILSHTPTFPSQSTPININYQYYNDYDKIALYVVYRETYGGRQGFRLLGELNGNQINGTFPIGMLPYGEYQFTMLIWDKAGNLAQDDYSLIVDEGGGLWQLSRSIQEIFMLLIGSTGIIVTVKSFRKQPDGFAEYQFTIPF